MPHNAPIADEVAGGRTRENMEGTEAPVPSITTVRDGTRVRREEQQKCPAFDLEGDTGPSRYAAYTLHMCYLRVIFNI